MAKETRQQKEAAFAKKVRKSYDKSQLDTKESGSTRNKFKQEIPSQEQIAQYLALAAELYKAEEERNEEEAPLELLDRDLNRHQKQQKDKKLK